MMTDKDLTDDVLDEIIAGAKTSMEQYLALSLRAERAANRQQNAQQNIPENILVTQFKPVADLYGLTSPTGSETSFTFDAVEARDFIDGGWSCQEYVELERYQEAVSGNSPVIPDGWKLVPIEPTYQMCEAMGLQWESPRFPDRYKAMLAAVKK